MTAFFPSRWPIMCAVMNQVSDLKLALAVTEAGGLASLYVDRYDHNNQLQPDAVAQVLQEFRTGTGHCDVVLGLDEGDVLDPGLLKILCEYQPSHVEFLPLDQHGSKAWYDPKFPMALKILRKHTKILCRVLAADQVNEHADGLCIKGQESAGRSSNTPILKLFASLKKQCDRHLIPYGGIGSPKQVRAYQRLGAAGVAVGTMFAAAQESCLSTQAKLAMCSMGSEQIHQLTHTQQNAIIFSDDKDLPIDPDDWNRERSLKQGIYGNGRDGHLYVGRSIDQVTKILPVKEIMRYLTSDLD